MAQAAGTPTAPVLKADNSAIAWCSAGGSSGPEPALRLLLPCVLVRPASSPPRVPLRAATRRDDTTPLGPSVIIPLSQPPLPDPLPPRYLR